MHTSKSRLPVAFPLVAFALALLVSGCALVPWLGGFPGSSPGPFGTPGVPPIGRDEAVAIARQNATQFPDGDVLAAELGTWHELGYEGTTESPPPAPDDLVWRINLGYDHGPLNAAGEILLIDASDGRVLEHTSWIS